MEGNLHILREIVGKGESVNGGKIVEYKKMPLSD